MQKKYDKEEIDKRSLIISKNRFDPTIKIIIIMFMNIILLLNIDMVNSELLEPLNIFLERKNFYYESRKNFSNNFDIIIRNFTTNESNNIYEGNALEEKKCIATKFIKANQEILSFDLDNTINLYDNFPFKKIFLNLINDERIFSSNKNMTNYLLLSLRLLFDLKANFKETYILLKKYDEEQFQYMKNYLIDRPKFIHKYIQLLPLSEYYGQMSWSLEDIEEYKISGILPVIRDKISKFYKELIDEVRMDKEKFYLYNVTNHWLNENNLNYFMSLYGFVIGKSIKFDLDDITNNNEKKKQNSNYKEDINSIIQNNGGGLIIIPFFDQCRHYQPNINNLGKDDTENLELKKLKIEYNKKNNKIILKMNKDIFKDEEITYSYTDFLTNDNLLLNYGILFRNNIFQEFLFKFEMEDPGYIFFKLLKENNFDTSLINISDEYKLNVQFSLKKDLFSKILYDFISVYSKNYIKDRNNVSGKENKSNKKDKNILDSNNAMLLRNLILYESTINKNIYTMFDLLKEDNSINNKITNNYFYDKIKDEQNKIEKINTIIYKNIFSINKEKNSSELFHDDVQNLFYYKALHDNKKSLLLKVFNFENLKILFSHKNVVNKETISILNYSIKNLKKKYIA